MSFMRRLMTQKVGSSFIPFQEVFYIEGIAATITAPTGCDTANIQMWGSGGRGGNGRWFDPPGEGFTGGDAGAGAYLLKVMSVSGGSSSFTCNVGIGGTQTVSSTNTTITGAATLTAGKGANGGVVQTSPNDDGLPGDGGVPTGGDAGSLNGESGVGAGIQGGSSPYGGAGGAGGAAGPTSGSAGLAPGGGGGGGSFDPGGPTAFNGGAGARGEIRIKWYKSAGGTSPVYTIYNIPITVQSAYSNKDTGVPVPGGPVYPDCANTIQQIYTNTSRNVWNTGGTILRSISFVKYFINNAGSCSYDSENSTFTVRIKSNSNVQLSQDFFTSVITPNGFTFNSSDATLDYDNLGGTPTYDTIWTWNSVSDGILSAGTNQNIRFKV